MSHFQFARELHRVGDEERSTEAEIMDWADDIAYAVHDLEDFYRAGLIPLDRLLEDSHERRRFLEVAFERWSHRPAPDIELRDAFVSLLDGLTTPGELAAPYSGSLTQRAALRSLTSLLISRYVMGPDRPAFELAEPDGNAGKRVRINPTARNELAMLKRLTWEYVIYNPRLATQQHGQRRVLRILFEAFFESAGNGEHLLSPTMADLFRRLRGVDEGELDDLRARIAVDSICRMTEDEALRTFHKITGNVPGSILDPI